MNQTALIARVAAACGLSKAMARRVVEALFHPEKGVIATALRSDGRVYIAGFGTFAVQRLARANSRNPQAHTRIRHARSVSVTFLASFKRKSAGRSEDARAVKRTVARKRRRNSSGQPPSMPEPPRPASGGDELWLGGEAPGDVQFTIYHPKEIKPRRWYAVLVYVHLPDAIREVQTDSRTHLGSDAAEYGKGRGQTTTVIKRGAEIVVVPELPGCRFNPARASVTWLKDWHRLEFDVRTDPDEADYADEQAVNGRIAFYVGPVLVGEARIWAHTTEHGDGQEVGQPPLNQ